MQNHFLKINKAAQLLNISQDTLRRWDREGKLKPIRYTPNGPRYYDLLDLKLFWSNLFSLVKEWILDKNAPLPPKEFYCSDSSIFQARLHHLEQELQHLPGFEEDFSLLTSVVGEIGNNSFDHNIGSWIDVPGIFFAFDLHKRHLVLGDRGQGILTTLRRVRPTLQNDEEALRVAFTERITGRAPEARGNGLKYVRSIITSTQKTIRFKLFFQTGQAALNLEQDNKTIDVYSSKFSFRGCLAFIEF